MPGERARILVVDDEPANLQLLVRMLRKSYDVVTAASGPEALAILAGQSFAAILTDQRMPEMTGTEFLARAKSLVPETVRMILTGYAPEKEAMDAINEAHISTFLTKPVAPDIVQRAVADAVELYDVHRKNQHLVAELAEARRRLDRDFEDRINAELERIVRYGGIVSLALIEGPDLELLERTLAGRDHLRLRATDEAGRLGGRMAVLMPGTARAGAHAMCARLAEALAGVALRFAVVEAPADGQTRESLIAAALE